MDIKTGLYDSSGTAITGSTDLTVKIKRDSNDYFYDFNDSTFKASGHTSISSQMSEPDATNAPGEYELSVTISGWSDGVYTAYVFYGGTPAWVDAIELRVYDGEEIASPGWTATEEQQIRYRLGLDGTTDTPAVSPNLEDHYPNE